jgi:hypothetical protein
VSIQLFQFSIKVVPEQSEKVEYERESLLGIAKNLKNFLAIPASLSRSYSTFPLFRSGTTLIEIAVYSRVQKERHAVHVNKKCYTNR